MRNLHVAQVHDICASTAIIFASLCMKKPVLGKAWAQRKYYNFPSKASFLLSPKI
eukprot:c35327_g1_i1 orf=121-285(+)